MHGLHFLRPDAFLLLVAVVPLVVAIWWGNLKLRERADRQYGEERLIGRFFPRRFGDWATGWSWVLGSAQCSCSSCPWPVLCCPIRL